jgi:hypothetical protein
MTDTCKLCGRPYSDHGESCCGPVEKTVRAEMPERIWASAKGTLRVWSALRWPSIEQEGCDTEYVKATVAVKQWYNMAKTCNDAIVKNGTLTAEVARLEGEKSALQKAIVAATEQDCNRSEELAALRERMRGSVKATAFERHRERLLIRFAGMDFWKVTPFSLNDWADWATVTVMRYLVKRAERRGK